MKVLSNVYPTTLGRAVYRIDSYRKKYAPSWVEFTNNPSDAELQILDVIGQGSMDFIYNKNIVLMQHCYVTTETSDPNYWCKYFDSAKLVTSYYDLNKLTGRNSFNFYRMPLGVDPEIFKRRNMIREYKILTTGYVTNTESINEIHDAVIATDNSMVHVGHKFPFKKTLLLENISDDDLVTMYNKVDYVSGLRKGEGFELPVLEGLLCGARGICFNAEHYKYWYGELVDYIDEGDSYLEYYSQKVTDQLISLFSGPVREVNNAEIEFVKQNFSWEVIMKNFWKQVENAINS